MAESDASRLVEFSKSVQAPTPKWHKTLKVRTPRLATPQVPNSAKLTAEKRRPETTSSVQHCRHRHKSTQDTKLEREDGDRFIPNRTLTDFNYASQQILRGEDKDITSDDDDDEGPKSMYEFGSSCKRKVKGNTIISYPCDFDSLPLRNSAPF